ncbi:MAG: glycosyltransferase [Candidatus Viridilinea halotolerans]|uniref:Glycosyltransferase n=1 Tax=Candidatus Viridilinea halotolerans TaxID=2491704 RepID=A0A426U830_9CHLR|nr:MAG: glycosyltransferase [Candidatus Viridilinea halotolerans]
MRILILTPYPPYPLRSGGALRVYHVARGLAERHEVTLLSFAPDAAAVAAMAPLRAWCHVVTVPSPVPRSLAQRALTTLSSSQPDMALRGQSRAYAEALSRLVAAESFAVILAASIEMASYLLPLHGLGPRLVLDQFNAEYLLQRRAALNDLAAALRLRPRALVGGLYSLLQWRKLARYERMLLQQLDATTVVSEEDRCALARLQPHAAQRLVVVPNGVDTSHVRPGAVRGNRGHATLVFTGTLDYRPNIDALRWFTAEVLPLICAREPATRLLIVGRAAGAAVHSLASATVEIIGEVAEVAPYIDGAAVYIVPMRIGGGSRLKLLEALAMEAPVVSTPLGAEGILGLRDGEHLLLAAQPQAFADAVLRLIADPALGQQLGAAGRAHVVADYDWRSIMPCFEQIWRDLALA